MTKRSQLRSSTLLTLLLALIVPVLAACGGSSGGTTAATSAPAASGSATSAPAAADATAAPAATSGDTSKMKPGIIRMAIDAEGDNYDPQQESFVDEIRFTMLNYQALMTFDGNMKPIPGQAEKVDQSADGKTYTFHLRANAKYSDGSPLTAKNYEFAWKRLGDPTLAGQYQFIACDIIVGYTEYAATTCPDKSGNTKTLTDVKSLDLAKLRDGVGVKAVDDNTLQIQLVTPAPYFLDMAALWIGVPVREEDANSVDNLSKAVPENYIGNGPFQIKTHEQDNSATWEANPNYQGPLGPVKLKGLEMKFIKESQVAFQAYKNGELDMLLALAPEDLSAVNNDATLSKQAINIPGQCTFGLNFNLNRPPFDNIKVRQAFSQAIDRDAWVRDIFKGLGKPTQTFIPPGFPGYDASDKSFPFDPAAAKKTLADAGFADGKGLPEIKLTFSASERNKTRNEWIANQLKQNLGVDAKLDPVDATAFSALNKDPKLSPQISNLGWCADYPDPQDWLSLVYRTGGNVAGKTGYSNKEFDKLTLQADVEPDAAKRADLYAQAQKLLVQDAATVFLYNDANKGVVKPYVTGADKTTPIDYIPGFFNLPNLAVGS